MFPVFVDYISRGKVVVVRADLIERIKYFEDEGTIVVRFGNGYPPETLGKVEGEALQEKLLKLTYRATGR